MSVIGFGTDDRVEPASGKGGTTKSHGAYIPFVGRSPGVNTVTLILLLIAAGGLVAIWIGRKRQFI